MWSHTTLTGNYGFQSIQRSHTWASPSFTKGKKCRAQMCKSDETDLISSSFLILCQDWNDGVFSCVTQSLAASSQGSGHLLDVFSASDMWPRSLSQTVGKKSSGRSCKTVCDAAYPNRITGSHCLQMKEKQLWHPSLMTDGGHMHGEVIPWAGILMNIHTCIFPHTHAVEVLLHEHSFSTGGRRVVWGFSLMAQFSCWGIIHFCCFLHIF